MHAPTSRQFSGSLNSLLLIIVVIICTGALMGAVDRGDAPIVPSVRRGGHGMVVSAHPLASEAGLRVMKYGGNAVDVAVTVHFVLSVVYPNAGNLGGGGFLLYRSKDGEALSCDFRETAPALASRDMFLDSAGNIREGRSLTTCLAAGVPGSVAGMWEAHRKLGRLPWRTCLQPALDLALKGFRITKRQAEELNKHRAEFIRLNPEGCVFVRHRSWRSNDILKQTELARTLRLVRDHGRRGFYEGETARRIVDHMSGNGGIITREDLVSYHPQWRPVLRAPFRSYTVLTMPPPSSGGVALLQLLRMWEDATAVVPALHSAEHIHLMAESERRVFADRSRWLGDPDFVSVPVRGLLDSTYLRGRMRSFDAHRATPSDAVQAGTAEEVHAEREQTTHYSIVDTEGAAVSVTTTLNDAYGSKIVVSGAGFLLNNEMDDFSVKAGTPNMYGVTGGTANAIEPHKRMLSSMTPTIVEENGRLRMVVGSPGGPTIITSVFQTIVNHLDYGLSIQEAVNLPRFHHQWLPDRISLESGCLSASTRSQLTSMGHILHDRGPMGRVDAITVDRTTQRLQGGADPRGDDAARGM